MSDCTCFVTPESTWTTHYGAVEPGSTMEPNPDCPEHFPESSNQMNEPTEDLTTITEDCAMAELSEEGKQWQLQRKADQSDLINWILHYKNPADDVEKLRQIKLVME